MQVSSTEEKHNPKEYLLPGVFLKIFQNPLSIAKSLPDFTTSAGFLIDHAV